MYGSVWRKGKPCPFSLSGIQNKTTIFKLMALRDTWCMTLTTGPLTNFGLLIPVVCFVYVSAKLYKSCPTRDKCLHEELESS